MIRHLVMVASVAGTAVAGSHTSAPAAERLSVAHASACSSVGGEPRRLELADGRVVSIDVRSLARSREWVLAAGRHAYVFPRSAKSRTSPTMVDSVIGALVDGSGAVSLVLNPLAPVRVFHPRVAPAPGGSFHVLFATGLDTVEGRPRPGKTVTIWHGTFSRGEWSRPNPVARLNDAYLNPEAASVLLARNDELSILLPFRDDRSDDTDGGVILLRGRRDRWTADTLRTYRMPAVVRAVHDESGALVAALVMPERSHDRLADRLFVARFDSTWRTPRRIAGDGVRPIATPLLARSRAGFIVSWIDWRFMDAASSRLEWLRLDATLRAAARQRVDSGEATYPFELITVGDRHPLWLYHSRPFGEGITLAMGLNSTVARLRPLVAPFRNPIASTIAVSGNRFLVFTQRSATTDNEPMAASYMTHLEIRCPRSEQR